MKQVFGMAILISCAPGPCAANVVNASTDRDPSARTGGVRIIF